jgi:hypothetical protein
MTLPTFAVRDIRLASRELAEAADRLLEIRDPNRAQAPEPGEWSNVEREFEAALRDLILALPSRALMAAGEPVREGGG